MKILLFDILYLIAFGGLAFTWYLFRPLTRHPRPAPAVCLNEEDGEFKKLPLKPRHIFGIGLSYAQHIAETAHEFDPQADPAVFIKANVTLRPGGGAADFPRSTEIFSAAESMSIGLGRGLTEKFGDLPPLLDYEAELAYILLTDISDNQLADGTFVPKLGFFIANDLSSRALQILGEGMHNRLAYWGMSKSFAGFLPTTKNIWIPDEHRTNAIPCVTLQTRVNGELRQNASTADMIYTPLQMLRAARKTYPDLALKKGDIFIMGTPGGIALATPRWKGRLAELLRFSRFTKLQFVLKGDHSRFLKPGDRVVVSGSWLGEVQSTIR